MSLFRLHYRPWLVVCASVLACALVVPSVSVAQAPPSAPAIRPRVAVLLPLSGGSHSRLGDAARDGLGWAQSVLPIGLELDVRDTAGDADIAAALVAELAADPGVVAIVRPLGSASSAAAAQVARDLSIPLLTLTSADGIENVGPSIFRLRISPEAQARALARLAVDELLMTRAAVFYPDDGYGRGSMRAFADAFVAAGGVVTAIEAYGPEDSRPNTEAELLSGKRMRTLKTRSGTGKEPATRAKSQRRAHVDFDVLFVPDHAANVTRALSFLRLAGVPLGNPGDVQVLGTSAWTAGSLRGTEGLAVGAFVARLFDPIATEEIEERVAAFTDAYGRQPTALEAQAHDGLLLLSQAVKRCSSDLSRGCVQQGLRSGATVQGVTGMVRLTTAGALARELYIFDVDDAGNLWPAY